MEPSQPFLPGSTIGILGSGQLGRMMTTAAKHMGYRVVVMGAAPTDPAAQVADQWIPGNILDPSDVIKIKDQADVVTIETENVSAEALAQLAQTIPVRPDPGIVAIAQDRLKEKGTLSDMGVPVAPFRSIESLSALEAALKELGVPAILKTTRGGYDGKGQVRITDPTQAAKAFQELGGGAAGLVLEAVVPFEREISVVVARGVDGQIGHYPVVENEHRGGILHRSVAPAPVPAAVAQKAQDLAAMIAANLNLTGLLAVEMFLLESGDLVVNELAPRPHNSGHFTLDTCVTSQFEQVVRAVCGLGLGSGEQLRPAVMLNILGEHLDAVIKAYPDLSLDPLVKVHLYGKTQARPGRKMGHILVIERSVERAAAKAALVWHSLGFEPGSSARTP